MPRRHFFLWLCTSLAALAILWLFYSVFFVYRIHGQRVWGLSDDVYVSACYARSLAQGAGLVWFPGDARVEGFSNPLWVLLLALFHRLPGFAEDRLGLFVMLTQSAILLGICALFWRCWRVLLERASETGTSAAATTPTAPAPCRLRLALLATLLLGAASIPYWMAEGFEVGLLALLALAGLLLAAHPQPPARRAALIGALAGLAATARPDGPLYFAATGLMLLGARQSRRQRLGNALAMSAVTALITGATLLARHTYYHAWLPNTYYLKLEHWPLASRLRHGLRQNRPLLPALALAWLPLSVPAVWRRLRGVRLPVTAALATFTLAAAYSTHNGGDAWGLKAGYDRFASIGSLFLVLAGALAVHRLGATPRAFAAALAYAALVAALPLALNESFPRLIEHTVHFTNDRSEGEWIEYGMAFREVAQPGARIAIKPAGAIIYFSHRGGVDLLGKCEPFVAHKRVNAPNHPPGHNKQYADPLVRLRRPDFLRTPPPEDLEPLYRRSLYQNQAFYARRDSPKVRWDRLTPADLAARVVADTVPASLSPGQRLPFRITLRNTGDVEWTEQAQLRLAVFADPGHVIARGYGRMRIPPGAGVKTGDQYTFSGELDAPPRAGRCPIEFRMVKEGDTFFGQSLKVTVEVKAGRATAKS